MKLRKLFMAPIGVIALCVSSLATADTLYTLNLGNSAVTGTGPYATADVHWVDITTATVTFDSLSNGGYLYLMGDGGSVGVNVNATSWSFNNVVASNSIAGFTASTIVSGGAGNEDGFGAFNQTFNSQVLGGNGQGGFSNASDHLAFTLHNTSGIWASSADVLKGNSNGYSVAIHAFGCAQPCSQSEGAAFTGFAVNGPVSAVPEPETYAMLFAGLGLMGFVARRRKLKLS